MLPFGQSRYDPEPRPGWPRVRNCVRPSPCVTLSAPYPRWRVGQFVGRPGPGRGACRRSCRDRWLLSVTRWGICPGGSRVGGITLRRCPGGWRLGMLGDDLLKRRSNVPGALIAQAEFLQAASRGLCRCPDARRNPVAPSSPAAGCHCRFEPSVHRQDHVVLRPIGGSSACQRHAGTLTCSITIDTTRTVSKTVKIIERMRLSPQNVRFDDLAKVCAHYFGEPRQEGTSRGG